MIYSFIIIFHSVNIESLLQEIYFSLAKMQKPEVVNLDDEDEDVEIQYIPKGPMKEEEWMLDNPSQPKVFALSGFTP